MRPRRYPLEVLARHREQRVDASVRDLAVAVTVREAREGARLEAERQRQAHEAQASGVRQGEREALEQGSLSAADLVRAHAWQLRVDAERAALLASEQAATSAVKTARDAEEQARGEVAGRRADAAVIDKDRTRWTAAEQRASEARDEEAAAEARRTRR